MLVSLLPRDCSMSGIPVLHCLLEFAQIHVHWDGDAIQPSHPLLRPSHFVFNLSQHQSLSQWVSSFASGDQRALASVLPVNIEGWCPLVLTGLLSKGLSRVFSSTTIWEHQFFGAQPCNTYAYIQGLKKKKVFRCSVAGRLETQFFQEVINLL